MATATIISTATLCGRVFTIEHAISWRGNKRDLRLVHRIDGKRVEPGFWQVQRQIEQQFDSVHKGLADTRKLLEG